MKVRLKEFDQIALIRNKELTFTIWLLLLVERKYLFTQQLVVSIFKFIEHIYFRCKHNHMGSYFWRRKELWFQLVDVHKLNSFNHYIKDREIRHGCTTQVNLNDIFK